jgi:hypothetical protein
MTLKVLKERAQCKVSYIKSKAYFELASVGATCGTLGIFGMRALVLLVKFRLISL